MNVSGIKTDNAFVPNAVEQPNSSKQANPLAFEQPFSQVLQETISMMMLQEVSTLANIGGVPATSDGVDNGGLGMSTSSMDSTSSVGSSLSGLLSLLPNFISGEGIESTGGMEGTSQKSGLGEVNTAASSTPALTAADNALGSSPADLTSIVDAASSQYQLPTNLLSAVIQQESGFNSSAVSNAGAQGLMQLMPDTAASLGVTNALDPAQNVQGGAKYLRQLLDQFNGSVPLALAAYNAGPGAVQQYGGIPPYAETQAYVSKIIQASGQRV